MSGITSNILPLGADNTSVCFHKLRENSGIIADMSRYSAYARQYGPACCPSEGDHLTLNEKRTLFFFVVALIIKLFVALLNKVSRSLFRPSHFTVKSRILLALRYIEFDNSKKDFVKGSVLFWVT